MPTGTLAMFRKLMVIVEVEVPSAKMLLVPVIVEFAAVTGVGAKVTAPPTSDTGVTRERIFISEVNEAKVQVETPAALEEEQAP